MKDKFVIVDIHPSDSFYDVRDELLGAVITASENWHESAIEDYDPLLKEDGKYMAGEATLDKRIEILNNSDFIYFYAVMVMPLADAEKS